MQEYLKHLLIRTKFEQPAQNLQRLYNSRKKNKHPELEEIYLEPQRIDKIFESVITTSSNCIDIGCHLGSTLSKITKLAPEGKHIAFEPISYKARWLKQKFPEVEVREIALGDRSETVKFYQNISYSGFSGLEKHTSKKTDKFKEITITCEPLDQILLSNQRLDFLKIDVEGAELMVLRGAINTLRRHQPTILFECSHSGLRSFNFNAQEIYSLLTKELSYSIFLPKDFLAKGDSLDLEKFTKALEYPFQAFNFVAVEMIDLS